MTTEPNINNTSSGAVATHGGVAAGASGIAVGGNVGTINYNAAPSTPLLRAVPPPPPPHFTGREDDLKKITQLLTSGENVAITALQGMGGIGKTALAQKLAERLQGAGDSMNRPYPGGVLWWTLGPNPDVITALDVWARHADPRADLSALPDAESRANIVRSMLARLAKLCIIIDDAWTESSARTLMSAVPPHCPILITTRDGDLAKALRCNVQRIDALSEDESIALLIKLFNRPLLQHRHAAREIAQLTEGLPLALELIYGLADSPADLPALAKKLREKPMLNILKLPGDEIREKSIEACLAMSYTTLDADMQRRFRALGVFAPAPFDRAAIAAVWAEQDEDMVDAVLKQLIRRSLLTPSLATPSGPPTQSVGHGQVSEPSQGSLPEYRQHALLHAYALALLDPHPQLRQLHPESSTLSRREKASTGEGSAAPSPVRGSNDVLDSAAQEERTGEGWGEGYASRHADYYRRFAETQDWRAIEHAFDQIDWGWRWVQANAPEQIIDYVFAVKTFLNTRGRHRERLNLVETGLAQARAIKDRKNEGTLLNNIGAVYRDLGQQDKALDFYQQALAIRREVGDRFGEGTTLHNIGHIYNDLGQQDKALEFYHQALTISHEVSDRSGEGTTLNNIGAVYNALGQKDKALDVLQQVLAIHREVGNRSMEGTTLSNLGAVYNALGQKDKALDVLQQALDIRREVGDRSGEGTTLNNIGKVYDDLGQKDKALDFFQQALIIHREVGNRSVEGATLWNMGDLFERLGRLQEAETSLQAAFIALRDCSSPYADQAQVGLDRVRRKLGGA